MNPIKSFMPNTINHYNNEIFTGYPVKLPTDDTNESFIHKYLGHSYKGWIIHSSIKDNKLNYIMNKDEIRVIWYPTGLRSHYAIVSTTLEYVKSVPSLYKKVKLPKKSESLYELLPYIDSIMMKYRDKLLQESINLTDEIRNSPLGELMNGFIKILSVDYNSIYSELDKFSKISK